MAEGSTAAGTAEARGVANNNAYGACEGPGGPLSIRATAEVAARPAAAVTTAVAALDSEVAELQLEHYAHEVSTDCGKATAGPPSGAAAPLDGSGCAGEKTPGMNPPQTWRRRLGVGPSNGRDEQLHGEGGRPTTQVFARRRDGTVAPLQVDALARGGGRARNGLQVPQRTRRSHRVQRRGRRWKRVTGQGRDGTAPRGRRRNPQRRKAWAHG